ncbi:MAG TPA: MarR family transcriptional regulator [Myxococcaceae bacterium]|nr:MarR family transcriptional regulator [Myxococcaceae bacterium]
MTGRLWLPGAMDPNRSGSLDACVCTSLRMLSRYASNQLDRILAGSGITLTEFQLMLTLWREGPARVLPLARRLRLDPGPTGRSLARLEQQGLVSRASQWRFSPWALERGGAVHLEVLEPFWEDVDERLRSELGSAFVTALVRAVSRLPAWVPRQGRGWFDD